MINNIIKFSLNNKYLIILLSVVLVVFGVRTAVNMDVDVFPDLTAPTVVVMTDAHGMASEEVERLVTFPILMCVNPSFQRKSWLTFPSHRSLLIWQLRHLLLLTQPIRLGILMEYQRLTLQ